MKYQKIKLEFTSNTTQTFNIDTCYENPVNSSIKSAGKINNEFFVANYKFTIDTLTNTINNIYFLKVVHINNNGDDMSQSSISSNFSNISEDSFEQQIYNKLNNMLLNALIKNNTITLNNTDIDFLVLHIKIGTENYSSNSNEKNLSIEKSIENSINKDYKNITESKDSTSSKKPVKTKKNKIPQSKDTLKLVGWSSMVTFIMHIFKSKINK